MNKKLILSAAVMSVALATIGGATLAYFSDTETSVGNTFTTGTIDIAVDDQNPWVNSNTFQMLDMKPSYTEYIDFRIDNVGTNPANVWKELKNIVTEEGIMSEPECEAEGGTWVDYGDNCTGETAKSDIHTVIGYDLSVKLYDKNDTMIWNQMLYNDDVMISDLPGPMFLGMIPAGWYMEVHQSYHMRGDTGNWAQGDTMTFDIELYAEQLKGVLVLEDKNGDPDWDIDEVSAAQGTLTYEMSHPTFDFDFTGIVPTANVEYVLISYMDPWPGAAGTHELGRATAIGNTITISGDEELGESLDHVKVWLVLATDWDGTQMTGWNGAQYLFETGLMEYRDTDM